MTVQEIISGISAHQVEGMMLHNDMADYYDFLGLMGFKRMHEYHFVDETMKMRKLHRYYINHYEMLLPVERVSAESHIPVMWHDYKRREVEEDVKQKAVISGMRKWIEWEEKTKAKYEQAYRDLYELGEVAAALHMSKLIEDVDKELKTANRLEIRLISMGYDMPTIISMQNELHACYKAKIEKAGGVLC